MNPPAPAPAHPPRYLGLDVGAETIKLVELVRDGPALRLIRRRLAEHHKEPAAALRRLLAEWDWPTVSAACVCGRLSRQLDLPRVPVQQALARAWRHRGDNRPATLVSIGSHGFSVLELRDHGIEVFRENSRCSQGTGNFLRQLVERFSLTVEEASAQAAAADRPATLSGRCPVILKSDMTHLANKGEDRARILAGLFDAVADNVQVLIKPGLSPRRVVLLGGVTLAPRVQRAFGEFAARHDMELLALPDGDGRFFEALGCALVAAELPTFSSASCGRGAPTPRGEGTPPTREATRSGFFASLMNEPQRVILSAAKNPVDRSALLSRPTGFFAGAADEPDLVRCRSLLAGDTGRDPLACAGGRLQAGSYNSRAKVHRPEPPNAIGCAPRHDTPAGNLPGLDQLFTTAPSAKLEKIPPLAASLDKVRRMPPRAVQPVAPGEKPPLIFGFDIGSTGSKAVALDAATGAPVWEGYRPTYGDPVGAAQALLRQFTTGPVAHCPIVAFGATGSGREITGSLLATCYGKDAVFILNEIAAHAEGALSCDARVDTIFEIGGQDAKYIRLAEGRVVDCAMNEACSAGTGSFIEEQGRKFAGIRDVVQFGEEALAAREGVSLGQHCSVFMAEIIDEAVAAGVEQRAVIAGLYDSIIQNYLNRVKGHRSVGKVIFCQGMPFSSDALAAAVARQTGSEVVIPPNPGTVGALGIARLARRELLPASHSKTSDQPHCVVPTNELPLACHPERSEGSIGTTASVHPDGSFAPLRMTGGSVPVAHNPPETGDATKRSRDVAKEANLPALDPQRFLGARVEAKDCFICKATSGCGTGNRCRIERLRTLVEAQRGSFTWGGGCALHDKGTRKRKLPDLAPDPFREREELVQRLVAERGGSRGRARVALSDEFMLKGLFPFFATFLHELGFELTIVRGGDHDTLKRGIQEANVPFCAPMQQFHGLASRMAETGADYLFLPMIRSLPRTDSEPFAVTCPIVQASPDILQWDLPAALRPRVLSPVIDVGPGNLDSLEFRDSCRQLAEKFGTRDWPAAHRRAAEAQAQFDRECLALGRRALEFCAAHHLTPVVVLGRPYTIHHTVLNSNVPAILREQGAIALPLDCYPVEAEVPRFRDMFWSHGQRILRAAHQIRRTPGLYSLYCSNYSCGPDSFNLHFYAYIMAGKPFAIIETDGHSGDAGTKTRVEAFLHCVAQDQTAGGASDSTAAHDFSRVQQQRFSLAELCARDETLLVPSMGPGSEVTAACFRGVGLRVEHLPQPDAAALRHGRRYTSGKECLPLCVTLGNLLKRLEPERHTDRRFTYLLTTTHGPCREGAYNLLNQITLERLGWADRVRIWAPPDSGYFDDLPAGVSMLIFTAFMASDLLLGALHDVRPVETRPGAAQEIYARHYRRLVGQAEAAARKLSASRAPAGRALREFAGGRLFGLRPLLEEAAADFAAVRGERALPTVLVVGEIFVRCEPFSNDFLIEKLERRGLRPKLAPFHEWLDYSDTITRRREERFSLADRLASFVQQRIQRTMHRTAGRRLDWPEPRPLQDTLTAVEPFLRTQLNGEAVLSLGTPLQDWRHGHIDAVVSVGPLECMPNKIAEAQFFHVAEQEGLPSLTLPVNGDPVDDEVLDNFAFLVRDRFRARQAVPN